MDGWRPSTKRLYSSYLRKWATFCLEYKVSLLRPSTPQVCKFLRVLCDQGLGHGAVNTARSALSVVLPFVNDKPIGKHYLVCLAVKGVYERFPPRPKYSVFWDVNKVFTLFNSWEANEFLTLKLLTLKVAVLMLLVSAQRGQTILNLDVFNMTMKRHFIHFGMTKLLKHNKPGDPLDSIIFKSFGDNHKLCVVHTLKTYIVRSAPHRKEQKQLLLSYIAPHKAISRDTLARWTLTVLNLAKIDTNKYKSHSTRGAAASAARYSGIHLNLIMKQAGWRCATSFARHYNKRIEREEAQEVSGTLLSNFQNAGN